uniref:Integrase catalytic domain-containing protein n=1 Tax=Oryzias sinensis TaxID=183150 RepID=A0A8C7WVX5_9TELE
WWTDCCACQTRRSPVPKAKAPMGGSPVSRPLQRVAADILELPLTSRGHRYVLVVEDYFTKFVNVYALPNQPAETVARCLFEDYVLVHGVPEVLHSDQGRQFEAEVIQNLCRLLGIAKTRTAAYNPKSDGMVERHNRTLIDQLAKMLLSHGGEWDDHLKSVAFAYNTSKHSSTRFTPFYLMHGREAQIPAEVLIPSGVGGIGSAATLPLYVSSLVGRLEIAFSAARVNEAEAQEKQKLYHDENSHHKGFTEGALVWLNNPTEGRAKLAPHWKNPYRVDQVLASGAEAALTYRIVNPLDLSERAQVVHHDRLKRYPCLLVPQTTVCPPTPTPPHHHPLLRRVLHWTPQIMVIHPNRVRGMRLEQPLHTPAVAQWCVLQHVIRTLLGCNNTGLCHSEIFVGVVRRLSYVVVVFSFLERFC